MKFSTCDSKARPALFALALGALLATTPGCIAGDIEEDSAAGVEQETVAEAASELSPANWNGHRYLFVAEPTDWVSARDKCASFTDYYLAQIYTDDEQRWLRGKIGPEGGSWWIGYNDRWIEGTFRWVAGAYGYSNWADGQPNDANNDEDCTVVHSWNGLWNDVDCSSQRKYICERSY